MYARNRKVENASKWFFDCLLRENRKKGEDFVLGFSGFPDHDTNFNPRKEVLRTVWESENPYMVFLENPKCS
jgi:hypothetical protein